MQFYDEGILPDTLLRGGTGMGIKISILSNFNTIIRGCWKLRMNLYCCTEPGSFFIKFIDGSWRAVALELGADVVFGQGMRGIRACALNPRNSP